MPWGTPSYSDEVKSIMLDFTSALYLGMNHAHHTLRPWKSLTTGRPAVLESPSGAETVARNLAHLIGCERATLGTSTLHIFWDLFEVLARENIAIFVDEGTYPIARWGVERMAARGVPVATFPTHDPAALEQRLARNRRSGLRPVVVTDGLCPATGRPAPLDHYLRLVRAYTGYLVIDDTQALGILGKQPTREVPYGRGGGGTPAWHGLQAPELIIGSSLAKGFGVPLAILAGSRRVIDRFEALSSSRVHCSAPCAVDISAAEHALVVNRSHGDYLRSRLTQGIQRFRLALNDHGISIYGGFFPVQTPSLWTAAGQIHAQLLTSGIKTVLHKAKQGHPAQVSFLITATHEPWEIDRAAQVLLKILSRSPIKNRRRVRNHGHVAEL